MLIRCNIQKAYKGKKNSLAGKVLAPGRENKKCTAELNPLRLTRSVDVERADNQ